VTWQKEKGIQVKRKNFKKENEIADNGQRNLRRKFPTIWKQVSALQSEFQGKVSK
jgi:hypothetical protein